MSRPFKHRDTGVYYFRKAVPDDLRDVVGRREVKRSLRTKDPAEAKRLFGEVAMEVAAEWARLRSEPEGLSRKDALALTGRWYGWFTKQHEDDPGESEEGWTILADRLTELQQSSEPDDAPESDAPRPKPVQKQIESFLESFGRTDEFLRDQGVRLSTSGRGAFFQALEAEFMAALRLLARWSRRDYSPDDYRQRFPDWQPQRAASQPAVSLTSLFDGWAAERKPPEKTRYSWRKTFDQLAEHLGQGDASRVTKADIVAWKDALIVEGKALKTIRDSKLAPVRAVLQWAVDNDRLPANPAKDIKLTVKQRTGGRRGFNDAEAKSILSAALEDSRPHYRWVPWICALSGARISEVCQLRGSDIRKEGEHWVMHLTWDAGDLKNQGSERKVPLHPALVARGLLDFARRRADGPLFLELTPDRFGNRGGNGTKVLGRWVRETLKIDDPRLGPAHSWRHRFKTLCRLHGIGKDFHDALTGHAHADEGDAYGEFPVDALAREIEKLPDPLR